MNFFITHDPPEPTRNPCLLSCRLGSCFPVSAGCASRPAPATTASPTVPTLPRSRGPKRKFTSPPRLRPRCPLVGGLFFVVVSLFSYHPDSCYRYSIGARALLLYARLVCRDEETTRICTCRSKFLPSSIFPPMPPSLQQIQVRAVKLFASSHATKERRQERPKHQVTSQMDVT